MSLIPWTTKGDNPTVVTDPSSFRLEEKAILVLHLNEKEVMDPDNTNVSYDLHVGDHYLIYRDGRIRGLDDKNNTTIKIPPREAAVIYTKEQIHFPRKIFGLVVPRQSLQKDGLSNTATKVDPGYGLGPLQITVFNHHCTKSFELHYMERFCALMLFQVEGKGARPRAKGIIGPPVTPGKPRLPRIRGWVALNQPILYLIALIVSFIGNIVLVIVNFFIK